MVLGLIDFLLGGKKKTKVPRTGQVVSPASTTGTGGVEVPDGQANVTENVSQETSSDTNEQVQSSQNLNFQDSNSGQNKPGMSSGTNKKSVSVAIAKIYEELKSSNERMSTMVSDIKNIENTVNSFGHRIDDLEEGKKAVDESLGKIDTNMTKFLSLYELINNQYNPFVEGDGKIKVSENSVKNVMVSADGTSLSVDSSDPPKDFSDLNLKGSATSSANSSYDLESSLLSLDTLNIEQAAGDAVPLTQLKNNTNSLVIILSWLEYLIKKVGIVEARNTLRYYTETLRWITPEVFFDLDKYLRGMKDKKLIENDEILSVRDHIVSLYFISKLNEKTLDEKLTTAVLEIIKQ